MAARSLSTAASASRCVAWVRYGDLRTHDNPLFAPSDRGGEVVPCFIFDPREFADGRMSARRAKFLIESVADLKAGLRTLGSDLVVGVGKPEELLPQLVRPADGEAGDACTTLLMTEQCASQELAVERRTLRALQSAGSVRSVVSRPNALYDGDELRNLFGADLSAMPDVFTPFRQKVESRCAVGAPLPSPASGSLPFPASLRLAAPLSVETIPDLGALGYDDKAIAACAPDPRGCLDFEGGETAALKRLEHYIWSSDSLGRYFETRNGMLGADYSSKLAPWLALGCVSPRLVKRQCEAYERRRVKNKSTYWLVFELIWRDYFRWYAAKHGDAIFKPDGPAASGRAWLRDPSLLSRWVSGRTGVPLVDANMRELAATGFMSNRGRQNVASYLALELGLDWRDGARHFESHLLDYDVASNWGNWAAAAGVTGGRINRFNLVKQGRDYDASGEYVRHWLPELRGIPPGHAKTHEPWKLSEAEQQKFGVALGVDYPTPPRSNWGKGEPAARGLAALVAPQVPAKRDAGASQGGGRGRGAGGRNGGGRKRLQQKYVTDYL